MQLSYWKSALNDFTVNQQDMVKVRKSAMDLAKEFDRLLKMYEKQELSNVGLRETLKKVRQEKDLKEKQVQLANRTIERLCVKQGTTEAEDAVKDAHIRRLETKLAAMRSSGELKTMCEELEVRVRGLEQDVQLQQEKTDAAERRAREAEKECELIKRSLQIAAEQMTKGGSGGDVSSSLLLAVAKGQEEAVSLSKELADAKNKMDEMESALVAARNHLKSQHEALLRWKEFEASQLKSKNALEQEVAMLQEKVGRMSEQSQTFNASYQDLKNKLTETSGRLEMEKTLREEAEKKLEDTLSCIRAKSPERHDKPRSSQGEAASPKRAPTTIDKIEKEIHDVQSEVPSVSRNFEELRMSFENKTTREQRGTVIQVDARATTVAPDAMPPPSDIKEFRVGGEKHTLFDLANMDVEF